MYYFSILDTFRGLIGYNPQRAEWVTLLALLSPALMVFLFRWLLRMQGKQAETKMSERPVETFIVFLATTTLLILSNIVNIRQSFSRGAEIEATDFALMLRGAATTASSGFESLTIVFLIFGELLTSLINWRLINNSDLNDPVIYTTFATSILFGIVLTLFFLLRSKTTRRYSAVALYTATFWIVIFPVFAFSVMGIMFALTMIYLLVFLGGIAGGPGRSR